MTDPALPEPTDPPATVWERLLTILAFAVIVIPIIFLIDSCTSPDTTEACIFTTAQGKADCAEMLGQD